jgi:hypothetical protein
LLAHVDEGLHNWFRVDVIAGQIDLERGLTDVGGNDFVYATVPLCFGRAGGAGEVDVIPVT